MLIIYLILLPVLLLIFIQTYTTLKYYYNKSINNNYKYESINITNFEIKNPYLQAGRYHKAQLHLHTSNSIDVFKKAAISDTIKKYQSSDYHFLVITDHDSYTTCNALNHDNCLVISGIEKTIPFICWPLGKHLIQFSSAKETIKIAAHPNWCGNFGTGRWYVNDLINSHPINFLEIFNHHSSNKDDLILWHQLLNERGPQNPIWGVAVDDTDNAEPLNLGWIMVKNKEFSIDSLINSLNQGSFYATTGPDADFQINQNLIMVSTTTGVKITFLNSQNQIIATINGKKASYSPQGNEGFIRIEIYDQNEKTAWSQPFFLIPKK